MREQSRIQEKAPPAPPEPPPPAARPRRRWLRWLVRGVLGILLLLLLVGVGVVIYVQTPGGSARVLVFGLRAANEAIGLSVLVALSDRRSRPGRWVLLLAAAMACGVALEYAFRQ